MSEQINSSSPVPLYHQLKEIIKEKIESKEWKPGDKIPSENELRKQFNISRNTVKKSLDDLVNEGYLVRKQGRGTFVSKPKFEQKLTQFYSFSRVMQQQGHEQTNTIVNIYECNLKRSIARHLKVKEDERAIALTRVRSVDNEPLIFETTYFPKNIVPYLDRQELESKALYDYLENQYGILVVSAKEIFEPVLIREYESKFLGVKKGCPALLLDRIDFDENKRPISFLRSIIRGDRCRYYTDLF